MSTMGAEFDAIVHAALFAKTSDREIARQHISQAATEAGIFSASPHSLYAAMAIGAIRGVTIPAMNIRGLSYDFCRAIIRAAKSLHVGMFIIEIARSELQYTGQAPEDLIVIGLAAALREGYRGPLFFQGDHFKVSIDRPFDQEREEIETLIRQALTAGYGGIDIDASPLVDRSREHEVQQQRRNAEVTAHFIKFIRRQSPEPIAIGAEIGEIGGQKSTAAELQAFMQQLQSFTGGRPEVSKIAVQTGTSHGGMVTAEGRREPAQVDFSRLAELSRVAREVYGLAGVAQHGASTLPEEVFPQFPKAGCIEIHLSTEFQNLIFDHPVFPRPLTEKMRRYAEMKFGRDRATGQTAIQFFYQQRKRLWGPFGPEIAELPEDIRLAIAHTLEGKVRRLFTQLGVRGTRRITEKYVP